MEAYLLDLVKYAPPIVAVSLGFGFLMYRLASRHSVDQKEQNVTLATLMGNHMKHLESAVHRNSEVIQASSHVQKDTRRVLERLLDRL